MNVVHLGGSFNLLAPTYVQVDLIPPRISRIVSSTGPLYGIIRTLPSDDRYLFIPPLCLSWASFDDIPYEILYCFPPFSTSSPPLSVCPAKNPPAITK